MKKANATLATLDNGFYFVPTASGLLAYVVCTDGYTGLRCFTTNENPIEVEDLAYENAMEYWDALNNNTLEIVEHTKKEAKEIISRELNGREVYEVFLAD